MLTNIFKVISSFVLIVVFISLVTKREINLFVQNTLEDVFTTSISSQDSILAPVNNLLIEQSSSGKQASSSLIAKVEIKKIISGTSTKLPTKQVEQMPATTVYDKMNDSHSDTDESYKPTVSPCKVTMGFKIGAFDTRFGITKEEFIEEIETTAKIWENSVDRDLFKYNDKGPLTINLIFDERQARTVDISYLALEIENAKTAAQAIKDAYERQKEDYAQKGELFATESEAFKVTYKIYEDKVAEYNTRGGATKTEYDAMMIELALLQKRSKALEEERQKLLIIMEEINSKVARYNEFIAYINSLIQKSNSLGVKKFIEGRFVPSTNTIDIYQFATRIKLQRVITHELGHVLGINHNDNAYSIMYSLNAGTSTALTQEDLEDLKKSCSSN